MSNDTDSDRIARIRQYCRDEITAIDKRADEIARDGGYNATIGTAKSVYNKILDMTYGLVVVAALALFAGCAVDAEPAPCDACDPGRAVVTLGSGSFGSGQSAGSGEVLTCEALAPTADPACSLACTDFPAFMAGVQPGSCRFVTCDVEGADPQTIGACVDPK